MTALFAAQIMTCFAQNPKWLNTFKGNHIEISSLNSNSGELIKLDSSNNVYIAGYFSGGPIYFTDTNYLTLPDSNGSQLYVAKYNSNGRFLWAKRFGGPGDFTGNLNGISGLEINATGNIWICGQTASDAIFGNIKFNSNTGGFLARLDSNGNTLWVADIATINNLKSDEAGNIYVLTYYYKDTLNCILKYDAKGNKIWLKSWKIYLGLFEMNDLCLDKSGNSYIIGFMGKNVKIDGLTLNAPGLNNMFLLSFDPNGVYRWIKFFPGGSWPGTMDLSNSNEIYVTGYVDKNLQLGKYFLQSKGPNPNYFTAKFDIGGNVIWVDEDTSALSGSFIHSDHKGGCFADKEYNLSGTNDSGVILHYNRDGCIIDIIPILNVSNPFDVNPNKTGMVIMSWAIKDTLIYGHHVSSPFIAYFDNDFGTDTACKSYELLDPVIQGVYPNPVFARDNLTILFNSLVPDNLQCVLYDISGKQLSVSESFMSLDRKAIITLPWSLNSGMYFLNIRFNNTQVTKKIIVYSNQ